MMHASAETHSILQLDANYHKVDLRCDWPISSYSSLSRGSRTNLERCLPQFILVVFGFLAIKVW